MKSVAALILTTTMLIASVAFSDSKQKFKTPPSDPSLWGNRFYILLNDDKKAAKTIHLPASEICLSYCIGIDDLFRVSLVLWARHVRES
jgi:hypothetical protein